MIDKRIHYSAIYQNISSTYLSNKNNDINARQNNPNSRPSLDNSLKNMIKYLLSPTIENNFLEGGIKNHLDSLKVFRDYNFKPLQPFSTKSAIDVIATIFLAYKINISTLDETIEILCNPKTWLTSIRQFLQNECEIKTDIIEKTMGTKYFDKIKYVKGSHYVKLNHFLLDITRSPQKNSSVGYAINFKPNNNQTVHFPIKNKEIRDNLTKEEIKELKEEAKTYTKNIIITKVKDIKNPTEKNSLILKLIYFTKLINCTQRHLCSSTLSYKELLEIGNASGLFTQLGLTDVSAQLEFINHMHILTYRQNSGMTLKRYFIKVPLLALGIGGTLASLFTIMANGFTTLAVLSGIVGIVALTGSIIDASNNAGLSIGNLKTVADKINCGDRLESYSSSTELFFIELLECYSREYSVCVTKDVPQQADMIHNDFIAYIHKADNKPTVTLYDKHQFNYPINSNKYNSELYDDLQGITSAKELNALINKHSDYLKLNNRLNTTPYKEHEAWGKTPKTSDILKYLNQNHKVVERHVNIMTHLESSGLRIRSDFIGVSLDS